MTVQGRLQPLLVKMVSDKSDATTEDEETVEGTNLDVFFCFFSRECAAIPEEVDEADGDATINVEDKLGD